MFHVTVEKFVRLNFFQCKSTETHVHKIKPPNTKGNSTMYFCV